MRLKIIKLVNIGKFFLDQLKRLNVPLRLTHGFGVHIVFDMLGKIGYENPKEVKLFLVGIKQTLSPIIECCDYLSENIQKLIPIIGEEILKELKIV